MYIERVVYVIGRGLAEEGCFTFERLRGRHHFEDHSTSLLRAACTMEVALNTRGGGPNG